MSSGTKERSDMAAARMGDLLLKGYRMLDASCANCLTVLMQDRSGNNICVLCAGDGSQVMENKSNKIDGRTMSSSTPPGASEGATEVSMNEPTDATVKAGVDAVIVGIVEEMQAAAALLHSHVGILQYSSLSERQEVLKHIQMCVRTINDLKSIQQR